MTQFVYITSVDKLTITHHRSLTAVVVETEVDITTITFQTAPMEEHALCTHSLHYIYTLLTEEAEFTGRLSSIESRCGFLSKEIAMT